MKAFAKNFLMLSLTVLLLSACNKEKDEGESINYTQTLSIDDKNHVVDKGLLVNYGKDVVAHEGTNFDISLVTSGVTMHFDSTGNDIDSASGDGYILYFQLYSQGEEDITEGDYVYNQTLKTGTFDASQITVVQDGEAQDYYLISEGTLKLRISDGKYGISGDLTTKGDREIKISYKGDLIKIDER